MRYPKFGVWKTFPRKTMPDVTGLGYSFPMHISFKNWKQYLAKMNAAYPLMHNAYAEELDKIVMEIMLQARENAPTSEDNPHGKNLPGNLKKSAFCFTPTTEYFDPDVERLEPGALSKAKASARRVMRSTSFQMMVGFSAEYALPVHELHKTHSLFLQRAVTEGMSAMPKRIERILVRRLSGLKNANTMSTIRSSGKYGGIFVESFK